MRIAATYCALLTALLVVDKSIAAETNNYFDLNLEELMQVKVSSSTLTEESLRKVPSVISVFTAQQIQAMGVDYLHELINFVPGFQAFRQSWSGSEHDISARGVRPTSASREVLLLVDGQRMNREFDGGLSVHSMALANVEKIEFIRGPGSAIYGSNAFTGVISITTKKNTNSLLVSYGSHQKMQSQLLLNAHVGDLVLNGYANIYHDKGQAFILENTETHLPYPSTDPIEGYDVNLKLDWRATKINVIHFNRESEQFYVSSAVSNEFNKEAEHYSNMNITHQLVWGEGLTTDFNLRYYDVKLKVENVFPFLGHGIAEQSEIGKEFSVKNDWNITPSQHLQFGVEERHIDIGESASQFDSIGRIVVGEKNNRRVSGLYIQHQSELTDATALTLGVRYDDYSRVGSATSPRLGLTHQLSETSTVKLLYGEAFRAPTSNELIFINSGPLVGNPELKPETIATWELVWMKSWQAHSLVLTGFSNTIDGAVFQDRSVYPAINKNSLNKTTSQGIEAEYSLKINPDWQLSAEYTLFNDLPASSFRQADTLTAFKFNYQHNKWNVNIAANHAGERQFIYKNQPRTLDGYWLFTSKTQYFISPSQEVYVQAKNLFDERYFTPSEGQPISVGVPNRGRELSLGFNWRF